MRAFWGVGTNVGDTLTPVILEHFTPHKAEWVSSLADNKLLLCGSILEFAKPGDTVLGAGHYKKEKVDLTGVDVIALRGKLSGEAPLYGDLAILLPLIYRPKIIKTKEIGYVPHLWDQENYKDFIDINLPWREFVDAIVECERIVSSSLHGFIIAQAYGIPAKWKSYTKIPGGGFKYKDYMSVEASPQELIKALEQL